MEEGSYGIFIFFLPNNLCVGKKVTVPQLTAKIDCQDWLPRLTLPQLTAKIDAPESFRYNSKDYNNARFSITTVGSNRPPADLDNKI